MRVIVLLLLVSGYFLCCYYLFRWWFKTPSDRIVDRAGELRRAAAVQSSINAASAAELEAKNARVG